VVKIDVCTILNCKALLIYFCKQVSRNNKLLLLLFQKISIAPPQRVIENSEEEGSYRPKFLKEFMSLNWNFQRGGGFKPKNTL